MIPVCHKRKVTEWNKRLNKTFINFVQPLRNLIYQNATSGLTIPQAKQQIKEYIKGGKDMSGKLGRYIEQTSLQAVSTYSGAINMKLLQTFDYNGLLVTGTLIDNSSPQCIFAVDDLNRKLPREKWSEFKKIGLKNGLTEETTFDNIPVLLAHWGCRHGWYPVILKN